MKFEINKIREMAEQIKDDFSMHRNINRENINTIHKAIDKLEVKFNKLKEIIGMNDSLILINELRNKDTTQVCNIMAINNQLKELLL